MPEKPSQNLRVYNAIKRDLLAGFFQPGERMEGAELSSRHATSITPVRMALSRLAGESLVEPRTNDGFHAPAFSEETISELYAFNSTVLLECVSLVSTSQVQLKNDPRQLGDADLVVATEKLFLQIASGTGNGEFVRCVAALNDRLHRARSLEVRLMEDGPSEIDALIQQWLIGNFAGLCKGIAAYHDRRLAGVFELVKLAHVPRQN